MSEGGMAALGMALIFLCFIIAAFVTNSAISGLDELSRQALGL